MVRLWPPTFSDSSGTNSRSLDNTDPAIATSPNPVVDGATLYFQYWFRDPDGGGSGFNLSNGLEVTFGP